MRLLLDEMFPVVLADQLRTRGFDVDAINAAASLRGLSDERVLELATEQNRILLSENIRDFARIHTKWLAAHRPHAGVLYVSVRSYPYGRRRLGALLAALVDRQESERWPSPGEADFL